MILWIKIIYYSILLSRKDQRARLVLETKRRVIGQLIICQGCCCGATQKDRPEVPADWLKDEWRRRGLLKRFQLTMSGCVGPCDLPNVVVVNSEAGSQWLGNITQFNQYRSLVEWAVRSVDAGHLLELPSEFKDHLMAPWRLI